MEALFQNFTAEFTDRHLYLRGKKYLLGALCVEMLRHSELVEKGEAFLPEAQALEFEVRRGAFTSNDLDAIRTYILDILKVYRELKPLQMFRTSEQIENLNGLFNDDMRAVLQSVEEKPFMESEEAWERRFPFVKYPAYQTCYENTVRALIHISRMLLGLPMDFRFLFNHIHPIADAYSCDEKHTTEMLLRPVFNDLKANAASSLLSYTEIQTSKGKTEIGRRICFETYQVYRLRQILSCYLRTRAEDLQRLFRLPSEERRQNVQLQAICRAEIQNTRRKRQSGDEDLYDPQGRHPAGCEPRQYHGRICRTGKAAGRRKTRPGAQRPGIRERAI